MKLTGGSQARDHYYCYDTAGRLGNVKTGSCSGATVIGLGYDVQGNLQNRNGQLYSFDYGNRLREVTGKEDSFHYDGHGRRALSIRRVNGSSWLRSVYGLDGQLLFQQDQGEGTRKDYIYLGGSLIAERQRPNTAATPVTVTYQHTDALGTPIATTDGAKAFVDKFEYEPYGQLVNGTLKSGPGYTGHMQDAATGLTYMQQRYYDPMIGRFLSVDPVTAYNDPVVAFNRYKYAANNPFRFVDPDGRYICQNANGATCSVEEAKRMEGYRASLQKAHDKMRSGAAKDRVGKIIDSIGELNDNNGVTLKFSNLGKDGVLGRQDGSTFSIDEKAISTYASGLSGLNPGMSLTNLTSIVAGAVIGHEGSHYFDAQSIGKGNAYPWSRDERRLTEIRAYGVTSAVHNAMNMNSPLSVQGMSRQARSLMILEAANSSVENACKNGGYGC